MFKNKFHSYKFGKPLLLFLTISIMLFAILWLLTEPVSANTDDTLPPLIYAVTAPRRTTTTVPFKLTAKISDLSLGDSPIVHAEYFYINIFHYWFSDIFPMQASDGTYDEVVEDVEAVVEIALAESGWVSLCVVAFDSEGNSGGSCYITFMDAYSLPMVLQEHHPVIESISLVPFDGVVAAGDQIDFSATFTDANETDTHSAIWYWGDGSTTYQEGISSPVQASHIYNEAGIYPVSLTIWDSSEYYLRHSKTYESVIVYQPGEGFVAGGGWFESPEGAYVPDPTLTGKAVFSFISRYKRGSIVPDGNTKFQFKLADLNFHSISYDWLVIAGSKAVYKGVGTINNSGNYGFMISAFDADLNSNDSFKIDRFRIRIWDLDNNDAIIYDNQYGDLEGADPTTDINGGAILIQK